MMDDTARGLRARLEHGAATPADALPILAVAAIEAPTRPARLEACRLLGDLAGRALGAEWEVAERAAFVLLEAARLADTATDRRGVIAAMGRGFRNIYLLPFVHRRLHDRDPAIATAAITAAGGLGFPALESVVAAFVIDSAPPALRHAAIAALGHMGAMTAVDRIVARIHDRDDAAVALRALTEIRASAGRGAALAALAQDLEPEVQIAAVRYLAELGALEVLPVLRRLARDDDAEIRVAASMASRALKAERDRDAAERFLVALGEPDRAVRAVLARRLRTLSIADVLAQADVLLDEDAAGVVQVLGELREPEVTRYLLVLGDRGDLPLAVRARAIGTIEADQPWERDELVKLAHRAETDDTVRAAAIQAMAAFATTTELVDRVGTLAASPSAAVRGAVLWGLQIAYADGDGSGDAVARIVVPLLTDADPIVRRRAAYVAGNLGLERAAPALAKLLAASEPVELRIAAYVALGELKIPGVIAEVVAAVRREDDPRVLGAASNALIAADPEASALAQLVGRVGQLITHQDARAREAGVEIAGLLAGAVPSQTIAPLADDDAPNVRGAAAWALGRIGDPASERALLAAYRDDDPAVCERAAASLLALGTPEALAAAIAFVAGDGDSIARGELANQLHVPPAHAAALGPAIDRALANLHADDPAFEPLVRVKLATHIAQAPSTIDVDAEILAAFPSFGQLAKLAGFDALVKSVRTAESLFHTTNDVNADLSPPITLWMKVLENYVHAWLGPKLAGLQREPSALFEYVDRVIGGSWNGFQKWIEPRWKDPVEIGPAKVEVPLRSIPNAIRELQERRRKRLDSPLSITEWARIIVLFAVDHPATGFRNMLRLGGKSGEKTIALAHRLLALAAVRNLVTHRASAGPATLAAFRRGYYTAFEDLVALA